MRLRREVDGRLESLNSQVTDLRVSHDESWHPQTFLIIGRLWSTEPLHGGIAWSHCMEPLRRRWHVAAGENVLKWLPFGTAGRLGGAAQPYLLSWVSPYSYQHDLQVDLEALRDETMDDIGQVALQAASARDAVKVIGRSSKEDEGFWVISWRGCSVLTVGGAACDVLQGTVKRTCSWTYFKPARSALCVSLHKLHQWLAHGLGMPGRRSWAALWMGCMPCCAVLSACVAPCRATH